MASHVLPPPTDDDPATQLFDDDAPAPAVPDAGEGGKLKIIVSLLKRCLGVKDIAAMRLSLPASLLEPMPNLEYWQYLDRPDLFAAINDADDPFLRILAVLRFTFSKDLKFIRGKICKPYNSVLGEHFRAHWDVVPVSYSADPAAPPTPHICLAAPPAASGVQSAPGSRLDVADAKPGEDARAGLGAAPPAAGLSTPSLGASTSDGDAAAPAVADADAPGAARIRVVYLTEQVSHHPPISSYYMACPARHIAASGVDQIAARVAGATVRVAPGAANQGIFVRLGGGRGAGERYQITHPTAQVNGILRGSFYATVADSTIITATGARGAALQYRVVLDYKDESWLGKPQFAAEAVVHTYAPGETAHEAWTRTKHVPKERIVAYVQGSWKQCLRWRRASESHWTPLLDLTALHVVPKTVRPLARQRPTESRRLWEHVTRHLLRKEFGDATRAKLAIEQRQRELAAERKRRGAGYTPVYFEADIASGESRLTPEGARAVQEELELVLAPEELDDAATATTATTTTVTT